MPASAAVARPRSHDTHDDQHGRRTRYERCAPHDRRIGTPLIPKHWCFLQRRRASHAAPPAFAGEFGTICPNRASRAVRNCKCRATPAPERARTRLEGVAVLVAGSVRGTVRIGAAGTRRHTGPIDGRTIRRVPADVEGERRLRHCEPGERVGREHEQHPVVGAEVGHLAQALNALRAGRGDEHAQAAMVDRNTRLRERVERRHGRLRRTESEVRRLRIVRRRATMCTASSDDSHERRRMPPRPQ